MIKTFSKFLKKLAKTLNGDVFDMAFCLFNLSDTLVCEYATGYTLNSQNLYTEEKNKNWRIIKNDKENIDRRYLFRGNSRSYYRK